MTHLSNNIQLTDLPLEILINITEFLSTKDILILSLCSKHFHDLLSFVKFNENVNFQDISKLPYFDSFTNVVYYVSSKSFPRSLRILSWYCNDYLPSLLPDSLISLHLGQNYNRPLPQLPDSLKSLDLNSNYNQPLPQLPDSLKSLDLGWHYNQPLPQLPDSLISLRLDWHYNQPLPQLPDSLKSLHLGWHYNQPLPQLPNSLKCLHIGYYYNQPLSELPDSLTHLKVWKKFPLPTLPPHVTVEFFD